VTWSHPAYEAVARLVNTRAGLHFLPSRHDSAELGIRRGMAHAGVAELGRYLALIQADAAVFDALINELTIGETYFFREPDQFGFIRNEVLPEVRRRRGPEAVVRAWSAACASGEEAYSLAILFQQEGLAGRAQILATDVSRAALARAQSATYSNWSLRGAGAATAQPYLTRRGDRHVLDEKIRRRVTFDHLNLALDVYPSAATNTVGMDLILCRNVLIYFDQETVGKVAARLLESLAPGGWLLTASVDPPLRVAPPFEAVVTGVGVFYRRSLEGIGATSEDRKWDSVPSTQYPVPSTQYSVLSTQYSVPSTASPTQPHPDTISPTIPKPSLDPLTEARTALGRGDYARAAALTGNLLTDAPAALLHVRALANVDAVLAEQACAAVVGQSLSTELQYLHAVLLLNLGRNAEAIVALRRVLYLDRSLASAHFTLGSLLKQQGDLAGARRAYRNARDLCLKLPTEEVLLLSDGEQAGRLIEAATFQLAILEAKGKAII
jgi:chemotaxis protein methyltransferase CheR